MDSRDGTPAPPCGRPGTTWSAAIWRFRPAAPTPASFARLARNPDAGSALGVGAPVHDDCTTSSHGLGARFATRAPTVRVRARLRCSVWQARVRAT